MILTAVRDFLESKSNIRHLSRGKIFYGRVVQRETKPYIVLNRVGGTRTYHTLNEADATAEVVQVDVYDYAPHECEELAEAIRLAMSGAQNVFWGDEGTTGIYVFGTAILREDSDQDRPQDGSDRWVYRISRDYEVSHREPVPTH